MITEMTADRSEIGYDPLGDESFSERAQKIVFLLFFFVSVLSFLGPLNLRHT